MSFAHRVADGDDYQEALVDVLIEFGYSRSAARRKVREALQAPASDWRKGLT